MPQRIYCSELAQAQGGQLYGTAVHVDLWLLIEYSQSWRSKALVDNDLGGEVQQYLSELPAKVLALSGLTLRVQFIKQASLSNVQCPRLFLADGRVGHRKLVAAQISDTSALTKLDPAALSRLQLPGGEVCEEPIYLVCTNGQRDICCAKFGMPLFEKLSARYGERVWQTSHIGGHRYAPNLLCLPSGVVYGFVMPKLGSLVVDEMDKGNVAINHLRGTSAYTPMVQAAEYFARQSSGIVGLDDLRLDDLRLESCVSDERSVVNFVSSDGRHIQVRVVQYPLNEPILASCGAALKQVSQYQLLDVQCTQVP